MCRVAASNNERAFQMLHKISQQVQNAGKDIVAAMDLASTKGMLDLDSLVSKCGEAVSDVFLPQTTFTIFVQSLLLHCWKNSHIMFVFQVVILRSFIPSFTKKEERLLMACIAKARSDGNATFQVSCLKLEWVPVNKEKKIFILYCRELFTYAWYNNVLRILIFNDMAVPQDLEKALHLKPGRALELANIHQVWYMQPQSYSQTNFNALQTTRLSAFLI